MISRNNMVLGKRTERAFIKKKGLVINDACLITANKTKSADSTVRLRFYEWSYERDSTVY